MINKERLLNRFLEYVQIDSPTKEERDFAEHLMKEMEEIGFEVRMDNAGEKVGSNSGNVIGKLKGNTDGDTILFSAHMDTVSPARGIKPVIKDGVVYSDGTTVLGGDDKSGVAAILEGVQSIVESGVDHGDIEVVFSIYEEGGLFGAKNLEYDKLEAEYAVVLDSGGRPGEIITQGPAQNKINVTFVGKKAHAGLAPEDGISAIQMAAEAISNMNLLRLDEETTANIGTISGGVATNIVASEVTITSETRSLDNDKLQKQVDHMVKCCEDAAEKFGGKAEIEVIDAYKAFKVEEDAPIVKRVKEAFNELGIEARTAKSGGGSDTNILNGNGIAAVNLGVGMSKVHTTDEFIKIEDIETSAKAVTEIIKKFA